MIKKTADVWLWQKLSHVLNRLFCSSGKFYTTQKNCHRLIQGLKAFYEAFLIHRRYNFYLRVETGRMLLKNRHLLISGFYMFLKLQITLHLNKQRSGINCILKQCLKVTCARKSLSPLIKHPLRAFAVVHWDDKAHSSTSVPLDLPLNDITRFWFLVRLSKLYLDFSLAEIKMSNHQIQIQKTSVKI